VTNFVFVMFRIKQMVCHNCAFLQILTVGFWNVCQCFLLDCSINCCYKLSILLPVYG